ncbi:DNA-packaging protein [Pseudomonas qingdaonensis]|uniref:DNA-packaging protein n=1 Tax=Pseudomonas qingdaonensis TaxID=2056231 RepID=UPI003D05276A
MSALKPIAGWLLAVALAVAGLAINHSAGYDAGFAAAKAKGDTALAEQGRNHEAELRYLAESAAIGLKKAADDLRAEQARGNQLAADLGAKKDELRAVTDKLSGEVQRVTTLYRSALDAQLEPLPPAAFTAGFVRVWNSALFGTTSPTAVPSSGTATGRADAPSAGAGTADDLIVDITRADLLNNHVRNSERFAACRAQLHNMIEWNTKNGSK